MTFNIDQIHNVMVAMTLSFVWVFAIAQPINEASQYSGLEQITPIITSLMSAEKSNDLVQDSSNVQIAQIAAYDSSTSSPSPKYELESEGIPSRVLSVYDRSQSAVSDFLHPLPIVDTIQEHEKYGNSGDKFYPIGRSFVNTYEGFSNLLNRLLDTPVELAKNVSRVITDKLNTVGGRLVGL